MASSDDTDAVVAAYTTFIQLWKTLAPTYMTRYYVSLLWRYVRMTLSKTAPL